MFAASTLLVALCIGLSEAVEYRMQDCGHVIRRDHNGVIYSHHGYSFVPYPNNYYCLWRIQAPPQSRIRFFLPRMSVEYEPECGFDHLDIYDDANTANASRKLASLCGQQRTDYFVSSGPYLTLRWTSDWTVEKKGFLARYDFIPENSSLVEGGRTTRRRACTSSEVQCDDGFCVPQKFHCDGINDCLNKADEQGCPTQFPPTTTTNAPTTPLPTTPTQTTTANDTDDTTQGSSSGTTASSSTTAPPRSCGNTPIVPDLSEARVVGGKVATSGSWPWTVSFRLNGGHTCGGSILSSRWVMTAAHCVQGYTNPSSWTIVAGLHQESNLDANTQTIPIQRIIVHPQWNSQATDYDYTLLYLSKPLVFNERVQPICLPSRVLGADVRCFVSGWGATKGTGGEGYLKQAFVKTFNQADCSSFYGGITTQMICAGHREGGRDTCQGDSGGPLMCQVNGKWELHGATSFGGACAAPNSPGVYARVSTAKAWIQQQMTA